MMTVEELRDDVHRGMADLKSEVSELRADTSGMKSDVAAIRAVTDALNEQRASEAGAMWGKINGVDTVVRAIQIDYVKQTDWKRFTDAQALKDADQDTKIGSLDRASARGIGMRDVLQWAIQLIGWGGLAALIKFGGGN